jgi:hypothetical protein
MSPEVFGGRVLDLAKKLTEAGKMVYFKPLCFTSYVKVTPWGNPAGSREIKDVGFLHDNRSCSATSSAIEPVVAGE